MTAINGVVNIVPTDDGDAISMIFSTDDGQETELVLPHHLAGDIVSHLATAASDAKALRAKLGTKDAYHEQSTSQSLTGWDVLCDPHTQMGLLRLKMSAMNYDIQLSKEDVTKMIGSLQELSSAIQSGKPKPAH